LEKLDAIHARHAHVDDDDGVLGALRDGREALRAGECGVDGEVLAQTSRMVGEQRRVVVNAED